MQLASLPASQPEPAFTHTITSLAELRAAIGDANERVLRKDIGRIDTHGRAFIARSPFVLVSSADAAGRCDVSPKGDEPGFVLVLDEHTLVIPERPGNRRADTLTNVIENPEVGVLFLIPGVEETLRVNGRAGIVRDAWLLDRLQAHGKAPQLALVVKVREAYFHCPKAFMRSQLWNPERFVPREELPSLACIMQDQLGLTETVEELEAQLQANTRKSLW